MAADIRPELTITGHDQGSSYVTWQWVRPELSEARVYRIGREELERATEALQEAIPSSRPGESVETMVERVLRTGPFADPQSELRLSTELADLLLPAELRREIAEAYQAYGRPVLLHLMPQPLAAHMPWELFPVEVEDGDGGTRVARLIELADIVYEVPGGALPARSRSPRRREPGRQSSALFVVDPMTRVLGNVLDENGHEAFRTRAIARGHSASRVASEFTRADLHRALTSSPPPDRLVYVGHVDTAAGNPHLTGLALSDDFNTYGAAPVIENFIRPLSAMDFIEGTRNHRRRLQELSEQEGIQKRNIVWPAEKEARLGGADIWPMPPRVALVGCSSGADLGSAEPFGLVVSLINAGAEFVTATKWTLPTDVAFREYAGVTSSPLLQAALALDDAQQADDVVAAVCGWQRSQLAEWTAGTRTTSPLLWAAFAVHNGQDRAVDRIEASTETAAIRLGDDLVGADGVSAF